jgi:hypothetical protein
MSLEPLVYAVHVEVMPALALDWSAILPRVLALGAWHLEGVHAYHAMGVADVPVPSRYREPTVNSYLHF